MTGTLRSWGTEFGGRTILHVDMDAFFAQIEVLDRPELAGKPVVVGGGERGVVSTCSYEARRYGIRSAMSIVQARRLCPHAVFLRPRMARYAEMARTIRQVLDEFSPLVEPLSIDEAFLDMTGCEHFYNDAESMGTALKKAIYEATGLTSSVGIAPNKFLAKLASDRRKPNGLVIVRLRDVEAILQELPVESLWGVGPKSAERLRRAGIRQVVDIRNAGSERLADLLGPSMAEHVYALAHGKDERPVVPESPAKSIGKETTFEADVPDGPKLRSHLARLVASVGWRLRRAGLYARTVTVKIRYPNFETHTKSKTLPQAIQDDDALYAAAEELLDAFGLRRPLRLLGIYASQLEDHLQPSLFDPPDHHQLIKVLDSLNAKLGRGAVRRGRELER